MEACDGRRQRSRPWTTVGCLLGAALLASCGSSDDAATDPTDSTAEESSGAGRVLTDPLPSSLCPAGSAPDVVAYEFDGSDVRWASCTDQVGYRSLLPVTDGVVYVATYENGSVTNMTALDAATGDPVEDAPPPPPPRGTVEGQPQTDAAARVEVGDITVVGGQDNGIRALADGERLWTQPGVWVYDDVWAIDDGAVFAIEQTVGPRLVGYEVATGEVRWSHEGDPYREGLWPFHAVDGRLYTLWSNIQVRSTADGALWWRTDYPAEEMEAAGLRMTGVDTDGTNVFVSFATEASGGD